jgi:quinolinate synthase
MEHVKKYIDANKDRFLSELFELIRIPSISSIQDHKDDMLRTAELWKKFIIEAGADRAEVMPSEGNPVVYGEKIVDPNKPTVLVYGHYDVMPVDPIEAWESDPFKPEIRDGKIFARGADDDKGQAFMHAKAFELMVKTNTLPCNVKFMIEGEEEIGSPSLGNFCKKHKELLKADMIVFAGVHFMAETAKILSPDKKVLIPDFDAGCSLANSCPPQEFGLFKEKYPDHIVISYINCSALIKTMSDIICTSGNAVQLVESFPKNQKILFAPDKNFGGYINRVTGRKMILWNGACEVHDNLKTESIIKMKNKYPDAKVIAHPECKEKILELADFVGSTTALLNFTKKDKAKKFIVATESGILHQMRKESPQKEFYIVAKDDKSNCNDCSYMKMNSLQKLYLCMKNEYPQIHLNDEIIIKARKPIERMFEISRSLGLI